MADERPVIVHARQRNRPRVLSRNAAALHRGITPGMPLAEALSLLNETEPLVASYDPTADMAELRRLAVLCGRFGPVAGLEAAEQPESILVDVTGCAPIFGGERTLATAAVTFLRTEGYVARAGLAETIGLAWAAARVSGRSGIEIVPAGGGTTWLSDRPIELLRLESVTIALLSQLGLQTVGDLLQLPRAELPSRFGPALLQRLDQALGRQPESIEGVRQAEPLTAVWSGESPLTERTTVELVITRLLEELSGRLARWEAIAVLACRFGDQGGPVIHPATPSRSIERLVVLLRLRLDNETLPPEVRVIQLTIETVCLPPAVRTSLFDEERETQEQGRAVERLVERLISRLGDQAVLSPVATGDPLPERSLVFAPALSSEPVQDPFEIRGDVWTATSRPILFLPEPEPVQVWSVVPNGPPFRLRRGNTEWSLTYALGPERLETGWAERLESRRDYWRCETERGERLWLFRCRRTGRWYLHGLFP